jgi:hypothetical protein
MQHSHFSAGEESDSEALLLTADRTQRLTAHLSRGKQLELIILGFCPFAPTKC